MPLLSLDSLTLTDTLPADLIASAGGAGFDMVSLSVHPPAYPRQLLTPAMEATCAALLADTGIRPFALEAFDLVSEEAVDASRPALELGARLGAKAAVAFNLRNADRSHVADLLARFTLLAAEYDIGVNFEPIATGRTRTLAEAEALIADAGVDAGIVFDILHLVRTGGCAADVRAVAPGRIRHVQLSDGPEAVPEGGAGFEAGQERLYPGDGVFPLIELLRAAPIDVPWGIEAPSMSRVKAGMSPAAQALEAMAAMRRVIEAVCAGAA